MFILLLLGRKRWCGILVCCPLEVTELLLAKPEGIVECLYHLENKSISANSKQTRTICQKGEKIRQSHQISINPHKHGIKWNHHLLPQQACTYRSIEILMKKSTLHDVAEWRKCAALRMQTSGKRKIYLVLVALLSVQVIMLPIHLPRTQKATRRHANIQPMSDLYNTSRWQDDRSVAFPRWLQAAKNGLGNLFAESENINF